MHGGADDRRIGHEQSHQHRSGQRDEQRGCTAVHDARPQARRARPRHARGEPPPGVEADDRLHALGDARLRHRDEGLDARADRIGGEERGARGGQRGARHSHARPADQQGVQHDLHDDRDDPQHRREQQAPLRPRDRGEARGHDRAGDEDLRVRTGVREHLRGRADEPQQRVQRRQADHGGRQGRAPEDRERGARGAGGGIGPALAEAAGDEGGASDAGGRRHRAEQEQERGHHVDRRERRLPDAARDEPGVRQGVDPEDPDGDGGLRAAPPQEAADRVRGQGLGAGRGPRGDAGGAAGVRPHRGRA